MTRSRFLFLIVLLLACESNPKPSPVDLRIAAARVFTQRYASSRLVAWKVRAAAAGRDCDVLLVDTSIIMEDSMVEALEMNRRDVRADAGDGVREDVAALQHE